jgi:PAS domain S-box-containing protein
MKEYSERLVAKLDEKNEQLQVAHAELRQLLAHSPAVIYRVKIDGQTITPVVVSNNIERLLGVSVAESTRHDWWLESLHPEDRERVLGTVAESLTGNGYSMEYRIQHKDGSYHWVEDNNRMIHDASGHATEAVGVWTDITERKRAEEAMQQSEHKYRHLFGSLSDAAFLIDIKSQHILDTNLRAETLLGRTRTEILAMNGAKLFPPNEAADYCGKLASAGTGDSGELEEAEVQTKDGTTIPVRVSLAPIELYGRDLVLALMADVTERKRAEERLREQADIINRARDAIIIRNFTDQRVTFWNAAAARLYGWSADEAMGRPLVDLIAVDPQDALAFTEIIGATGGFSGEVKHRTKDGKEIIVEGRATLIVNPDGTPGSVLLINTDITKQKKLQTQLLRAQRLETIGTLASGVAHDLKNILTPILMGSEILHGTLGEESESLVSLMENSARRGVNIVKQVLTFARGVEGERVIIDPRHLIHEMSDIACQTFPKSIEIRDQYPEDMWTIQGDPTQLHQVLLNLSVNARDAMANGGLITIGAENFNVDEHYASMTPGAHAGPHVMLRVSDTGAGMSRAVIDKIFDPFFTTKEVGKGTGLGLSTVLGIVKSHGGFISVYSEIGKGTTLKIFLPAEINKESSHKSKISPKMWNGNGELVLVVDDEPGILRVTKMILEKHNYRVLDANDAPEALALFAQQLNSVNAVLTDIMMPYMDGVMLIRTIKKMKPAMKFIASTGQGEETRVPELETLHVTNFLTKPYDTERLLKTLCDTLTSKPSDSGESIVT